METVTMRYRMSDRDVFYGGGVVNGARSITLMNDCANRLMAKTFGNTGHCVKVKKVRLYVPLFAGDYMEYIARIKKTEGNKSLIEVLQDHRGTQGSPLPQLHRRAHRSPPVYGDSVRL